MSTSDNSQGAKLRHRIQKTQAIFNILNPTINQYGSTVTSDSVNLNTAVGRQPYTEQTDLGRSTDFEVRDVVLGLANVPAPNVPETSILRWVAGGEGTTNTLAHSADGISWTGIGKTIFTTGCLAVAWNGTRWVAGGRGTNTLAYSTDGISWTGNSVGIFTDACYAVKGK